MLMTVANDERDDRGGYEYGGKVTIWHGDEFACDLLLGLSPNDFVPNASPTERQLGLANGGPDWFRRLSQDVKGFGHERIVERLVKSGVE